MGGGGIVGVRFLGLFFFVRGGGFRIFFYYKMRGLLVFEPEICMCARFTLSSSNLLVFMQQFVLF